jgi:DNA-binding GntR family transcriptional regulator
MPVRESISTLQAEGLVRMEAHFGAIVAPLSLAEIQELYELRLTLEPALLTAAIQRLDKAATERAEKCLHAVNRSSPKASNFQRWIKKNWLFHEALYLPANRPLSLEIVKRLHVLCERYAYLDMADTRADVQAEREHSAIFQAFAKGDSTTASKELRFHIASTKDYLVKLDLPASVGEIRINKKTRKKAVLKAPPRKRSPAAG